MICKNCGANTRIVETRKYEAAVMRIRLCEKCLYFFSTWETCINETNDINNDLCQKHWGIKKGKLLNKKNM